MNKTYFSLTVLVGTVFSLNLFWQGPARFDASIAQRAPAEQVNEGSYGELVEMAKYAISRNYNALQLLRDMSRDYARQGLSVRFSGDNMRKLAQNYSIGNDVATALLPVERVQNITVGGPRGRPQITINLDRETTTSFGYLFFKIDLHLARSYGVYSIDETQLSDVRGLEALGPAGVAQIISLDLSAGSSVKVKLNHRPYPTVTIPPIFERRSR